MGKGAKGGGNKKSRRLEELQAALEAAPEPEASAESKPGPQTEEEKRAAEETEAQFMAALAREIGVPQEELTDEAVRAAMAKLSPAQLQKLAEEGKALKAELHSRPDDYSDEIEVFRDELNKRAEASDLPVEKDGEHLGKKIVAFMEGSSEPMPYLVLLEAVASTPYLVKLALAEAREKAAVADRADLDAIESELARLKVPGWRASDPEREGRPPFVRRNLLLVYFHMYASAIRALELDNGTKRACGEIMGKVARLLDMLFQYSLKNRWIKAALTITELQGLITNGLWSHTEDECRELMKQRLGAAGLKVPKLFLTVAARDVLPGETVSIKVEVSRLHVYTDDELDELKRLHITELPAAEAEAPAAEEAAAEGGGGGGKGDKKEEEQQPQEGWWVIGESIRKSLTATQSAGGKTTTIQAEEVTHNALVGRVPLMARLDQPTLSCELTFDAPQTPGEYKVMVHVRSAGCVGVDVRRKVVFNVQRSKRALPSSSSGASTEEPDTMNEPIEGDEVPPLEGAERPGAGDEPPPLIAEEPLDAAQAAES